MEYTQKIISQFKKSNRHKLSWILVILVFFCAPNTIFASGLSEYTDRFGNGVLVGFDYSVDKLGSYLTTYKQGASKVNIVVSKTLEKTGNSASVIGDDINYAWNYIKSLFKSNTKEIVNKVEIKLNTPIKTQTQTSIRQGLTQTTTDSVSTPTVSKTNTDQPITKILTPATIIQRITEHPQTTIINQTDPNLLERIRGVELAILRNINFNSNQTDRVYESVGKNINETFDSITENGILNNPTLNNATFANFTSSGNAIFTKAPTLAHVFSPTWPLGTSNVSDATLYINPDSSVVNGNLIGAAVNDVVKFLVDSEGTIYANNVVLTGSISSGANTMASLHVLDNTTLGDAGTDTITINGATTANIFSSSGATITGGTINNSTIGITTPVAGNFTTIGATTQGTGAFTTLNITNGYLSIPTNTTTSIVTIDGAQTLTNKTIVAGNNTISGITNANLSGTAGITNANLLNSTISGIPLGGTLPSLTFGTHMTGVSYNGSTGVTIATDATDANTPSTIISRDASGNFSAGAITSSSVLIGNSNWYQARNTSNNPINILGINSANQVILQSIINGSPMRIISASGVNFEVAGGDVNAVITAAGNMGVGTWNPGTKLDVAGGSIRTDNQLISTVAIGTAPLAVTSTTVNANLNADLLDGQHGSYYATAAGYIPYTGGTSNVNLGIHNLTVDTNSLFVDSVNHRVGIGTTSPGVKLEVSDSSNTSLDISSTLNSTWAIGQVKGALNFYSADASGTGPGNAGWLKLVVAGDISGATNDMIFGTAVNGGEATEKMRITGGGNVGIGTTGPGARLDVLSSGTGDGTTIGFFRRSDSQNSVVINNATTATLGGTQVLDVGASAGGVSAVFNGNVGIGTTNPGIYKLNVSGVGADATTRQLIRDTGTNSQAILELQNDARTYAIKVDGANQTDDMFKIYDGTASLDRFVINSSGNVGIGTTGPSAALDVSGTTGGIFRYSSASTYFNILPAAANGTVALKFGANSGTAPDLAFKNDASAEIMRLTNSGNVGIGTTGPGNKLDVNGVVRAYGTSFASSGAGVELGYDTATDKGFVYSTNRTAGQYKYLDIEGTPIVLNAQQNGNVGIGTTGPAATLDIAGATTVSENILNIANTAGSYKWTFRNAGNPTTRINLYGYNSAGALTTNISPDGDSYLNGGNVGIGTTAPGYKLDVVGSINASSWYSVANNTGYTVRNAANTAGRRVIGLDSSNNLIVGVDTDIASVQLGTTSEAMRIISNGNVGIGTTNPGQKLEVSGTIRQTGCTTAGTISVNASGDIICTPSSINFKNARTNLSDGLATLTQLQPVSYLFNENMQMGNEVHYGFISEEVNIVNKAFATHDNNNNPYGLDTNAILAVTVNAVKELNLKVSDLSSLDTSSATSLGSLMKNFLSNEIININEATMNKIRINGDVCVDDICVTKEQFKQILINGGGVSNIPVIPPAPQTITCGDTETLVNGACVKKDGAITSCNENQTLTDGVCVDNTPPADPLPAAPKAPECSSSQTLVDGACVENTPVPDPLPEAPANP